MSIKQFNGQWASDEDRLLFRFNTTDDREFRFWLTRHITRTIIEGSQQLVTAVLKKRYTPETAEAIQEFQQQTAMQTTKFSESYASSPNRVLGETPILVTGLVMRMEKGLMSIDLRLATKQNVNIKIQMPVFQKMVLLLNKLQEQAKWDVGLPAPIDPEPQAQGEAGSTTPGIKVH